MIGCCLVLQQLDECSAVGEDKGGWGGSDMFYYILFYIYLFLFSICRNASAGRWLTYYIRKSF
jgi:hypothetical protein